MNESAQDCLHYIPEEKWKEFKKVFLVDLPRGISGYKLLETQIEWKEKDQLYDFTVFCPYGDFKNGMVAFIKTDVAFEVAILTPTEDTTIMKRALKESKRIDWTTVSKVPYAPGYIIECLKELGINPKFEIPSEKYILHKTTAPFTDVSLHPNISFGTLSLDHASLVNECWPHKYEGSILYFEILIRVKYGFGLFINNELITWVFINESGVLGHMYTLEKYRRKGYAQILMKLICNELLMKGKHILIYSVKGNTAAYNLYKKLGFKTYDHGTAWCFYS